MEEDKWDSEVIQKEEVKEKVDAAKDSAKVGML